MYGNKRGRPDWNMMPPGRNFGYGPPPPPPEMPTIVKCGDIWEAFTGHPVQMRGRVVKARLGRFLEIRDSKGAAQLVADDERPHIVRAFQNIPVDSFITIIGLVRQRPKPNNSTPTGRVEVHVEEILEVDKPRNFGGGGRGEKRSYSTMASSKAPVTMRNITSIEYKRCNGSKGLMDHFNNRETTCGELRLCDVGSHVTLVGWFESKKHGRFLQLRDGYGTTQIVIDPDNAEFKQVVANVTATSIVRARGHVLARPKTNCNPTAETGEIEVMVKEFEILDPEKEYDGPIIAPATKKAQQNENGVAEGDGEGGTTAGEEGAEGGTIAVATPRVVPQVNKFTNRTHTCGELSESNIGEEVTLVGWMEFQRMRKFFTLRDGYGCTQVILPDDMGETLKIDAVPFESIIQVTGTVMGRPPGMRNETMITGGIEVILKEMQILNRARSKLPIEVRDHNRSKESLRLEHRYIDLRFADMQRNLRTRSKVLMKMREYLINHAGFIEVETPTLFRQTPGGAHEFVVPSRIAGHFYSLVQSPQQFKQMLMVGAIDRYFQVARCYRDEATRPDRQIEFTQLDIELSFTTREDVMALVEAVLVHCWPESCAALSTPFPVLTYEEAMEQYGSDKPDLRFDMKLKKITEILEKNETLKASYPDFGSYAILVKSPNGALTRPLKEKLSDISKQHSENTKFVATRIPAKLQDWIEGHLSNLVTVPVTTALAETLELGPEDLLLFAYGDRKGCQQLMGRIRLETKRSLEQRGVIRPTRAMSFLWVTDFPLFERNAETDALETVHHPFTAPHPDDVKKVEKLQDLETARSLAYDLVLNGEEVGGGSIRIHNAKLQRKVLDEILKIDSTTLAHMLEALECGCPPHGGIALGIDRLMRVICNAESIRDVIAFPKSLDGKDPLSKAPVPLGEEELKRYNIIVQDDGAMEAADDGNGEAAKDEGDSDVSMQDDGGAAAAEEGSENSREAK